MKRRTFRIIPWLIAFVLLFLYRTLYSFDNRYSTTLALCGVDIAILYGCSLPANRVLIPRLLYSKRYFVFAGGIILSAAAAIALIQMLQSGLYHAITTIGAEAFQILRQTSYQIFNSWLVVALGLICAIAYRLLGDHLQAERRYQQLQKEQAQTELAFLKAQINPHFLFNSINSIYAHIDKTNAQARDMVLQFSHLLRYQLYDCNTERIAIEKELAYLQDYVSLQRLRKDENIAVSLETKGDMQGFYLAPLLLIPFVENAFKYVSTHEDKPNELRIVLEHEKAQFAFTCCNTKDVIASRSLAQEGGIGIGNVRRRLELIYPGRHVLDIRDTETDFEVKLQIRLT